MEVLALKTHSCTFYQNDIIYSSKFYRAFCPATCRHTEVCLLAYRFDTSLTDTGVDQARRAARKAKGLRPAPELLVVSPLSRALHTADLAFPPASVGCPRIMHPLARERLYLSSDVGLSRWTLSLLFLLVMNMVVLQYLAGAASLIGAAGF